MHDWTHHRSVLIIRHEIPREKDFEKNYTADGERQLTTCVSGTWSWD